VRVSRTTAGRGVDVALVFVSLGILVALIVTTGIMDYRARQRRGRLRVDNGGAVNSRRDNDARGSQYGSHRPDGFSGGGF
jgi:hypothetical protein